MKTICTQLFRKHFITCTAILFCFVLKPAFNYGQAATASWALTANATPAVTGSITATNATAPGVTISSYNANGMNVYNWTTSTSRSTSQYYQVITSPVTGNSLTVSSISFYLRSADNFLGCDEFDVYYSINGFTTSTALQTGGFLNTSSTQYSYTGLNINIPSGSTLSLRIYCYDALFTGSSYYTSLKTLLINGATNLSTISGFTPTTGCPGSNVVITGTNFSAATAVKIGGTAVSSYTINSATQITAVPASGTTGTITVTTANGTATSAGTFTIKPAPTGVSASSSSASVCYGSTVNLFSTSNSASSLISQTFNSGLGTWTATNSSSGGTTAAAAWTLRANSYNYAGTTFNSNDNSQFLLSNSDAQGSSQDYTLTDLYSPTFSTVGLTSCTLDFYHNYQWDFFADILGSAAVYISTNGGSTYTLLRDFADDIESKGTPTSFSHATIDLTPYVGSASVKLLFEYFSLYGYWWALDNITVAGTAPAYTYAWTSSPTGFTATTQNASTSVTSNKTYTITVTNGSGCSASTSTAVNLSSNYTWTGLTSTNWNTLSNWCAGVVPNGSSIDVTIPNTTNKPLLNASYSVRNLDIAANAWVNLNGNTLTVAGTLNSGTGSTGQFLGSAASGLVTGGNGIAYFDQTGTNNYLKTLTVNAGTLTLGNSLNIAAGTFASPGTLTATGNLATANLLTLKSDIDGTARVGASTGTISGSVTVERYIPGLRAWRFLSVPFNATSQTIRDAWQEGVNNTDLIYSNNKNPNPGYGTHITGNNNISLGYDLNTTTNPSLKVWDSTANTWNANEPATISKSINSYLAYCLFVRGSRSVNLSSGTSAALSNTTLRIKGTLNQTGLTAFKSYIGNAGKIIFVGNPYASAINISSLLTNSTGIDAGKFWVWDPKRTGSGTNNVGGYVTYSGGIITPTSSPSYANAAAALLVQSGQAFMVQLSSASTTATMKFQESDKTVTSANVFGKQSAPVTPVVYTNLVTATNDGLFLTDGVAAGFGKKYSAAVDGDDAIKLWNFDENIALVRGASTLAIEFRPIPALTDTLFYRLYLRQQPYMLQIFSQNLPGNLPATAWLVDKYLNTKTAVNLYDTTLYNFTPNPDTNSYRNRFMLVFNRQLSTNPTPVTQVSNLQNPNITGVSNSSVNIKPGITVYPNPVKQGSAINLTLNNIAGGNYNLEMIDENGKKIIDYKLMHVKEENNHVISLSSKIASGIYNLRLINEDGNIIETTKLAVGN